MKTKGSPPDDVHGLRRQAEDLLDRAEAGQPGALENLSPEEARHTLHELRVHQIELEMQNSELRKAQVELATEQQRYFDLYDLAPVGYCTISEQELILKANLMAATLLGVTRRSALAGRPFSQFVIKDDQDSYYLHRKQLFKTGEPQSFELRLVKADGTPFGARLEAVAALSDDGESTCRVVISDISDQVALREAHDFLLRCVWKPGAYDFFQKLARYLAQVLGMDFVCIDRLEGDGLTAQTVAVYFDGHFEDNISYALKDTPCGEVVGQTVCCYTDRVRHLFPQDVVLQEMKAESYVGTTLWGTDGKAIGLIAVIGRKPLANQQLAESLLRLVGIRAGGELERTQAEEKLRKSEETFRSLAALAPVGVYLCDPDGRCTYVNDKWLSMWGGTLNEALGYGWVEAIHPEDRELIRTAWAQMIESRGNWGLEYRFLHRNGKVTWVYGRAMEQRDAEGQIVGYVGANSDISGIKLAQLEMVQAKVAAEAANRAKSTFLANMSHEIRTPLNGIMGMLQLMQTHTLDAELGEFVNLAIHSSTRLNQLLSDILDLSRVEAEMLAIASNPFNLRDALKATDQMFQPVAHRTGVQLRTYIDPSIPKSLLGDPARLQQVLVNLVGNAFKFTSKGTIGVEAYPLPTSLPGKYKVLFTVADTGKGIADEHLAKLFKPFSQVEMDFTRKHQGAGLGLSICKRLVKLMGGDMAVDSNVDIGTTFYFCVTFGAVAPCQDENLPDGMTGNDASAKHLQLLLVEDDPTSQYVIGRMLEKIGYSFTCVSDGQQALEEMRRKTFDAVLMDIQLPVMNGVEATQAIRSGEAGQDKANIPIIAMTAYAMTGDREKFLAAGMDDYLSKPLLMEDLQKALVRVVENISSPELAPEAG